MLSMAHAKHPPKDDKHVLTVIVEWDKDAQVFVAYSDDIPGLSTEAPNMEALEKRVMEIAPELLSLNKAPWADYIALQHKNLYIPLRGELECA